MSYDMLRNGIPVTETQRDVVSEEVNGRTGWDVVYRGRKALSAVILLAISVLIIYVAGSLFGEETLIEIAKEYWPALISPLAGWYLAKRVVSDLYRPDGRLLVQLDPENHLFRAILVPERMFRTLNQTGNNVVYHTPMGLPVYTIERLDLERGHVDYGWVHENDALVVMTRESAYNKWNETLNEVMEDNLELMVHPHIIGLGYARKSLRDHLNGLGRVFGFTDTDYDKHTTLPDGQEQKDTESREEGTGGGNDSEEQGSGVHQ